MIDIAQTVWNWIGFLATIALGAGLLFALLEWATERALRLLRVHRAIVDYLRWKGTFLIWVDSDMPLPRGDGSLVFKPEEAAAARARRGKP